MGRKRTTVFADEEDLAILKAAAERRGVAEAELLRDAIHLAAMANRVWDEPFFSATFSRTEEAAGLAGPDPRSDAWTDDAVDAYLKTKKPSD